VLKNREEMTLRGLLVMGVMEMPEVAEVDGDDGVILVDAVDEGDNVGVLLEHVFDVIEF
jgi:hypothetical protein